MKLLQINTVANWGSTGRIAEEIGELAISYGWESYIAYGRGKPKSKSHLIRIGNDVSMYFHVLQTRLLDNHGCASKQATRNFIKKIDVIKPDIIHLHNIHGYYLNYEILFEYLSKKKIPVVWTLHDCWSFTGHCYHFCFVRCEKWHNNCFDCPLKRVYPASFIKDNSRQNYTKKKQSFTSLSNLTLVPVSNWLLSLLKQSFLKDYPVQCIHNGINLKAFFPIKENPLKSKLNVDGKNVLLGVASVWNSRKGLDDFYSLRKMLSDEYLLILVGLNKKQIEKLPNGILGVTRTNSLQELAEYYSLANVYVNLTWEDTFPTTNLEALACGIPVVTYLTGGSAEALDEKTGIVVKQGDLQEVVKAVKKICDKSKMHYSDVCRKRAIELFDKNNCYEEYIDLYNRLL